MKIDIIKEVFSSFLNPKQTFKNSPKLIINRNMQNEIAPVFSLNLVKGEAKRAVHEEREILIVPVVMLRDTVANGARITVEELEPFAWNGVPVTLNHPTQNGQNVSANSPSVLEEFQIGSIFNANMDGDKLKAEAWLDVNKTNKLDNTLISILENAERDIDVSTGYFCDEISETGVFQGKQFTTRQERIRPDHLAILPNSVGACSYADGCGIRANQGEKESGKTENLMPFNVLLNFFEENKEMILSFLKSQFEADNDSEKSISLFSDKSTIIEKEVK